MTAGDGLPAGEGPAGAPAVRVFLQTRGAARAADYAFLGDAPLQPWWREYRELTAFDHPTVLVISDGGRWAAYLSGIPSARVDAVGTVVRYTLVLDGPCATADAACVTSAVAAWLADVAAGVGTAGPPRRADARLPAALDARFPPDDVQRWLTAGAAGVATEVRHRVLTALAALPAPAPGPATPGSWVGGVGSAEARTAFVARVGDLLGGAPGRALLLNLLGGPDDAAALLDPASPVAVLVDGASPARVVAPRGEVDPKKAPGPPVPSRTWGAGSLTPVRAAVLTALAVMVAVLAAVVILLL